MSSSKRILVFPFGLMAHYLRSIAYCKTFHKNDQCLFASHPLYNTFLVKHGFDSFLYKHMAVKQILEEAKNFRFDWVNRDVLESAYLNQVQAIQAFQPDLVIGDGKITLKMACQKTGVPYVSLMNAYMSPVYDGVRRLSQAHPRYVYRQKTPTILFDILTRVIEKKMHMKLHKPFQEIRMAQNLPSCQGFLHEYEGDFTQILDDDKIFKVSELRPGYKVVGPLFYSDFEKEVQHSVWKDDNRKKLIISLGSSGDWEKVIPLLESGLEGWDYIVLGGPESIRTHEFIPLSQALKGADLMICHGGNGTLYEGKRAGVKMVFVCNHFEQEWNAERFASMGFGRLLGKDEVLSEHILLDALTG